MPHEGLFVEAGGAEGEFVSEPDPAELRFKDLFREYRRLRDEFVAGLEAAKEENLKIKLQIIEELKELASSDEMLNQTFNKFRELQHRWKETGVVPQQNVKDLWRPTTCTWRISTISSRSTRSCAIST